MDGVVKSIAMIHSDKNKRLKNLSVFGEPHEALSLKVFWNLEAGLF